MARRKSKWVNILTYILVIMILVAGIGLIIKYSDELTTDLSTMYLEINGVKYTEDVSGIMLSSDEYLEISVNFLQLKNGDKGGYNFSLLPNTELDIEFQKEEDGIPIQFKDLDGTDIWDCFEWDASTDGIIKFKPKSDYLLGCLQAAYPDNTLKWGGKSIDYSKDLFILTVSSSDNKKTINIGLRLSNKDGISDSGIIAPGSVELDITEIVF